MIDNAFLKTLCELIPHHYRDIIENRTAIEIELLVFGYMMQVNPMMSDASDAIINREIVHVIKKLYSVFPFVEKLYVPDNEVLLYVYVAA